MQKILESKKGRKKKTHTEQMQGPIQYAEMSEGENPQVVELPKKRRKTKRGDKVSIDAQNQLPPRQYGRTDRPTTHQVNSRSEKPIAPPSGYVGAQYQSYSYGQ